MLALGLVGIGSSLPLDWPLRLARILVCSKLSNQWKLSSNLGILNIGLLLLVSHLIGKMAKRMFFMSDRAQCSQDIGSICHPYLRITCSHMCQIHIFVYPVFSNILGIRYKFQTYRWRYCLQHIHPHNVSLSQMASKRVGSFCKFHPTVRFGYPSKRHFRILS